MDLLFLIKKLITPLFYPLSVILILLFSGLSLIFFTKKRKIGYFASALGFMLLFLSSYDVITDVFLRQLENQYPPYLLTKTDAPRIFAGSSFWAAELNMTRNIQSVAIWDRIHLCAFWRVSGFTNKSKGQISSLQAAPFSPTCRRLTLCPERLS